MSLPLTLLALAACVLGCLIYLGLRRWKRWEFSALTLVAIVATGWAVVDLRWQWNLLANAAQSVAKFAGSDLSAKRLASVDGELSEGQAGACRK